LANPIRYTGREFDAETNLHFYRARYYDPQIGRFINEDPLRFRGGGVNFYDYVGGNPINYRDPSGQTPIYGQWCGPDWTGGRFEQYDPNHDRNGYYNTPIDPTDTVCQAHDICYYTCRATHPCDPSGRQDCMDTVCDYNLVRDLSGKWGWAWIIKSGILLFNHHPDPGPNAPNCPTCSPPTSDSRKK
jgi:RHS repeat-associated protein